MRVQQAGSGLPQHGFIDRCRRCALGGDPGDRVGDALGLLCELGPAGAVPDFGDRGEKLEKGCLRIIGPGMEGSPVGQQEERVRPAALAGQQLGGQHVGVVEIRTCLAVDLDGNEVRIQCPGHFLIIETLLFHDMTPVTGGISDREEDGPVLAPRSCKSLFTPGMPLDRVVGVLQQIGGGFEDQPVGVVGGAVLFEQMGVGPVVGAECRVRLCKRFLQHRVGGGFCGGCRHGGHSSGKDQQGADAG